MLVSVHHVTIHKRVKKNTLCCSIFVYLDYVAAPLSAARSRRLPLSSAPPVSLHRLPTARLTSSATDPWCSNIADDIFTASSPPPAIFSYSLRCPPPALATANHRCQPTAPILVLLCPPPALLLLVARPLSAPIIIVGACKGRRGMPPARSLFRRLDRRKR